MHLSWFYIPAICAAFVFEIIVFDLNGILSNLKYNKETKLSVKTKWNYFDVKIFGVSPKPLVLINLSCHFKVGLLKSELLYKKLEEVPWVKREYDPFVWGRGKRRGSRFKMKAVCKEVLVSDIIILVTHFFF